MGVAAYGGNTTDIIGVRANNDRHKIHHAKTPRKKFDKMEMKNKRCSKVE